MEPEQCKIRNFSVIDVLDKAFISDLKKAGNIDFITLVMMDKEKNVPIILAHHTSDEISKRIAHLECKDTAVLEKIADVLSKKQAE
jgi:hypothetical protein